jgi:hypothetical protein
MSTGGMQITQGAAASLAALASVAITTAVTKPKGFNAGTAGGIYRPPQWSTKPTTYSIVVPKSSTSDAPNGVPITNMDANGVPIIGVIAVGTLMYVFDAMLVAEHSRDLDTTDYPVQDGYNQSYNAVLKPNMITLEVGMSDAMDAYETGMWTGNVSKSISAWQEMKSLQANRAFLTLNTRLETYTNMMLVRVSSKDDNKTVKGARMLLTFKQIFVGNVSIQTITARPNATNDTNLATIQGSAVSPSTVINSELPSVTNPTLNVPNLVNQYGLPVNAGPWSSNNTAIIESTLRSVS